MMKFILPLTLLLLIWTPLAAGQDDSDLKKIIALQQAEIAGLKADLTALQDTVAALVSNVNDQVVTKEALTTTLKSYATNGSVNKKLKAYPTSSTVKDWLKPYVKCNRKVSLMTSSGKYHVSTTTDKHIIKAVLKDDSKARQKMTLRCR